MKYGRYLVILMVFLFGGCNVDQSNQAPLFIGVDNYYIPVGYELDAFDTLVVLEYKWINHWSRRVSWSWFGVVFIRSFTRIYNID